MGKNESPNLKWTIVLATITRAICAYEAQGNPLSLIEIENVVRQAATNSKAFGNLLAVLLRDLSELLWDVQRVNIESEEVQISAATKPQYEVWVGGEHKIVDEIREYEEKRDKFECWVSLDDKRHRSRKDLKKTIGPTAIKLLIYLVERIDRRTPFQQVLKDYGMRSQVSIPRLYRVRRTALKFSLQNWSNSVAVDFETVCLRINIARAWD